MARSVLRADIFLGQVALVTGGGTGIGKSIARELLQLGATVVIASRKLEVLTKSANELNLAHTKKNPTAKNRCHALRCNIREENDVVDLVKRTLAYHKRIDYLINNGGGQFPSPAAGISKKGWHAVVETNLTGTFLMCREVYTQWMVDHGGAIVNVIADMFNGFPGMAHTGASRAGVDNLTKTLALEWSPSGVRVNAVAPGVIFSNTAAANYKDADFLLSAAPWIPAKRLGSVEEVSSVICFLLSEGAAYVSGTTLRVDGCSSLWRKMWHIPSHQNFPVYGTPPPAPSKNGNPWSVSKL